MLYCPVYNDLRQILLTESLKTDEHFNSFTDCQKMAFIFELRYYKIMCQNQYFYSEKTPRSFIS